MDSFHPFRPFRFRQFSVRKHLLRLELCSVCETYVFLCILTGTTPDGTKDQIIKGQKMGQKIESPFQDWNQRTILCINSSSLVYVWEWVTYGGWKDCVEAFVRINFRLVEEELQKCTMYRLSHQLHQPTKALPSRHSPDRRFIVFTDRFQSRILFHFFKCAKIFGHFRSLPGDNLVFLDWSVML